MLPVANFARTHSARAIVQDAAGNEHFYLLHWSDANAAEVLAAFIGWSFHPEHPLTPCAAGSFISLLRSDDRVSWEDVKAAYKLAHERQMAEAAAIVYGGVEVADIPVSVPASKPNQSNHARDVDCGASMEPTDAKEFTALDAVDRSSAVAEEIDHRQGWQDREAPARIGRRARVSIFLLGIFQAAIVAAAIAAFVFTFAWGD